MTDEENGLPEPFLSSSGTSWHSLLVPFRLAPKQIHRITHHKYALQLSALLQVSPDDVLARWEMALEILCISLKKADKIHTGMMVRDVDSTSS